MQSTKNRLACDLAISMGKALLFVLLPIFPQIFLNKKVSIIRLYNRSIPHISLGTIDDLQLE